MHIPAAALIHLLHAAPFAALATRSEHLPGYPHATALPFVPDAGHRPVLLLSGLAEHTKNLLADRRASLLVFRPEAEDVLRGERLTLLGDVVPFDPSAALLARYLRYRPEAAEYLGFGDFGWFRCEPLRLRMIAGFGRMGWLDGAALSDAGMLPETDEAALLDALAPLVPDGGRLLGLDRFGLDLERAGRRARLVLDGAPVAVERLAVAARSALARPGPEGP